MITQSQSGYIVDTVYPVITLLNDVNPVLNSGDTITVNVSDDIQIDELSLLYGFSPDALCDVSDDYLYPYQSGI
ncbi:hypothetical protein [Flavobacterium sp.]|uniref:hypothetical protein n=1 Tax=Flavobacterium sp. TaxID=239 RepID=UPI0026093CC4|nr:hypothetical protein [Flavobacterium sp.]MDD2986130.1 hypothetical protein [Flavobacterium sp.]